MLLELIAFILKISPVEINFVYGKILEHGNNNFKVL